MIQDAVRAVTGAPDIQAEIVPATGLGAHAEALEALFAAAGEPTPFLAPWNLNIALEQLPEAAALSFALAWSGEELVGLMPLETAGRYARLPVRYQHTGMHRHCFLGTPLIRAGCEEVFVSALLGLRGLAGAFLQFRALPADSALAEVLRRQPGAYEARCWQRACLDSTLPYEGYLLANIRGKKRKEWRRLTKRLAEEGPVEFRTLTQAWQIAEWGNLFLAMEHEGWRGHGGSSLLSDDNGAAYLLEMIAGAHAAGNLHFMRLDVGDNCIAMLINFVIGERAWSFKIAHDPAWSRYSPGVMIELELTRQALEEKRFRVIDSCAAEDHPMIDHLWAERLALCHINVPLPGLANGATLRTCRMLERTADRTRDLLGTRGVRA